MISLKNNKIKLGINKEQWSWIMYDWANSAYGIIVTTAVLPVYFKSVRRVLGFLTLVRQHTGDMLIVLVRY